MAKEGFAAADTYANGGSQGSADDWARMEEASLDNWWGASLPEYAAKYGYHDVDPADFVQVTGPGEPKPEGYLDAMNGAEYQAGTTEEEGGCLGQWYSLAYDGVTVPREDMATMATEIELQVREKSRTAQAVTEASGKWSECMANEG
jgi:hypothetical protein